MRSKSIFFTLFFSTALLAQKTLHEMRVEENLLIMKFVGVAVVILLAMPLVLRRMKSKTAAPDLMHAPDKEVKSATEAEKAESPESDGTQKDSPAVTDTLDVALEKLFDEHNISQEERGRNAPLYRRYLEVELGKVVIETGSFEFNAVLDELTAKVHALEEERNFEVVYDIDRNVPAHLIGDAGRLTEILFFMLKSAVSKLDSYLIELKIRRLDEGNEAVHLEFYIPYHKDNYKEDNQEIFTPSTSGTRPMGLELYLARAYARLMRGDALFQRYNENDSAFVVDVNLKMPNASEMRNYRLPSKGMTGHSVLLVDDHKASALAIQKMFEYFKNEVDIFSSKELYGAMELLDDYDIVVIQERFFSKNLVAKLQQIRASRNIKVVSLDKNEEFEHSDTATKELLDAEISKPVTFKKVSDLLVSLYQE